MAVVLIIFLVASAASYKPIPPPKQCGENEYAVTCKTICPPQSCDIAYTEYACDPNPKCTPGCDCIKDYLRDKNSKCIFNEKCPGRSTTPDEPTTTTPAPPINTSESNSSSSTFSNSSSSFNSSTSSSSYSSASSHSSYNNTGDDGPGLGECTYNRCTPTCSIPYPQNCSQDSNPCNCTLGTIISEPGGKCVPKQECQIYANCEGDYNASYTDCPIGCPSTCAKPDAENCNTQCGKMGCECNPGYLLSEKNGTCIKPEECPGGNACKQNETFVDCLVKCHNRYCPVDDSRAILLCDPAYPCPSGCGCQFNYLRNNREQNKCILASECPPVNCTRPNEKWNPCPDSCFSDYCSERNRVTTPGSCQSSGRNCQPQCVCKQGFYRNGTDICVTAEECPPNS